jgi:hypothetical protein
MAVAGFFHSVPNRTTVFHFLKELQARYLLRLRDQRHLLFSGLDSRCSIYYNQIGRIVYTNV